MKILRLLQGIFAALTVLALVFLGAAVHAGMGKTAVILAAVYTGCGLAGSAVCAAVRPYLRWEKVFVYTEEQERAIDRRLGYMQMDYDKLSPIKQWHVGFSLEEIRAHRRRAKMTACPLCGGQLTWVRECTYIGLRHPVGATGGSWEKTYEVIRKRYCPVCQRIFD